MTMTEERPDAHVSGSGEFAAHPSSAERGLAGWVTTSDHKRVGTLYVAASMVFLVATLVIGGLLAFERIDPTHTNLLGNSSTDQLFSLYQYGLVFLVVAPLMLGLAIAIVPLQVGARAIAFPRAAALSLWMWLLGALVMIAAYVANGGPGGGNDRAVGLYLVALAVVVLGLVLGSVCVVTTVLGLRAPSMRVDHVPFFAFASMTAGVGVIFSLPVLFGQVVLLYVDHRYGRTFAASAEIARYLAWSVSQPQVLLYAVPALGFMADVVPVFTRSRQRMSGPLYGALAAATIVAYGADVSRALSPETIHHSFFIIAALGAVATVFAVLALSGLAAGSGKPVLGAPLVFAVVGGMMLLVGVAVGALFPWRRLGLADTSYEASYLDYVALGTVLAGLGALAYWGPKLFGRRVADKPAVGLAVLGLGGVVLLAAPEAINGFKDQPLGVVNFDADGLMKAMNVISLVGTVVLLIAVAGFVALALQSFMRRGEAAGDDPWNGQTFEWATSSPPPTANFSDDLGTIRSPQPLLDRKLERDRTPEAS